MSWSINKYVFFNVSFLDEKSWFHSLKLWNRVLLYCFLRLQLAYFCIFLTFVDFFFFFLNPEAHGRILVVLIFNHQPTSFTLIPGKIIDQVLFEGFSRPTNEKVVTGKSLNGLPKVKCFWPPCLPSHIKCLELWITRR